MARLDDASVQHQLGLSLRGPTSHSALVIHNGSPLMDHSVGWTFVAPSLIAVIGVLIGLIGKWVVDVRMQKREMKKVAYMDTATAIQDSVRLVSLLNDLRKNAMEITSEYAKSSAVLARSMVIAGMPLTSNLIKIGKFLIELHGTLLAMRVLLDPIHGSIEPVKVKISKLKNERAILDSDFRRANIIDYADNAENNAYVAQGEFLDLELSDAMAELVSLSSSVLDGLKGMAGALVAKMTEFPALYTEFLYCVRQELGFPFDKAKFLALQEEMAAFTKCYLRRRCKAWRGRRVAARPGYIGRRA